MELPNDPADVLNQIAQTHWDVAARHAWRQYQDRGRGAIVVEVSGDPDAGRRPLRYLTFTDEKAADGTFAMLHQLVGTYDPETQVVLAAVLPDGRTVFDVYEESPVPPEA